MKDYNHHQYNHHRPHEALDNLSPVQFRQRQTQLMTNPAAGREQWNREQQKIARGKSSPAISHNSQPW
jgi:hypothetical protein